MQPLENADEPADLFWAARGKKAFPSWERVVASDRTAKRDEIPFWAARGKKYAGQEPEPPFWAARGKKGYPFEIIISFIN